MDASARTVQEGGYRMRVANLDELVDVLFYDDIAHEWGYKTCTVEAILRTECDGFTEYEAEEVKEVK